MEDVLMVDELLTVREVAQRLKVNEQTVRIWLREGRIKGARFGGDRTGWRVKESNLEEFIERTLGGEG